MLYLITHSSIPRARLPHQERSQTNQSGILWIEDIQLSDDRTDVLHITQLYMLHYRYSENVALNKPATQIGDYDEDWTADKAVDGDPDGDIDHNHCAHPAGDSGEFAWWMVNLEKQHAIYNVTIYRRDDGSGELHGLQSLNHFCLLYLIEQIKAVNSMNELQA